MKMNETKCMDYGIDYGAVGINSQGMGPAQDVPDAVGIKQGRGPYGPREAENMAATCATDRLFCRRRSDR